MSADAALAPLLPSSVPGAPLPRPHHRVIVPQPAGWGLGMCLLAVPIVFGSAIVATLVAALVIGIPNVAEVGLPISVLFFGLIAQQLAMGAWPLYVAKSYGRGIRDDLRMHFDQVWRDLALGMAFGLAMVFVAGLVTAIATVVLGIEPGSASNTGGVTESASSAWKWPTIATAVLIAPIVEELFFRGMLLRAFENKWGRVVAVLGSSFVFTLIHYSGGDLRQSLVLYAAIGTVGIALAYLVLRTNRLLIAIVAHSMFNIVGVAAAFATA